MSDLQFHIEGEQAEATAVALEALITEQFGQAPRREPPPVRAGEPEKADFLTVASVILALPSAIVDAVDLAERIQLKEKMQRLIAFAQRQFQEHGTRIWLKRKDKVEPLPLDAAKLSDLLDE